jgi:hypothetical protein
MIPLLVWQDCVHRGEPQTAMCRGRARGPSRATVYISWEIGRSAVDRSLRPGANPWRTVPPADTPWRLPDLTALAALGDTGDVSHGATLTSLLAGEGCHDPCSRVGGRGTVSVNVVPSSRARMTVPPSWFVSMATSLSPKEPGR